MNNTIGLNILSNNKYYVYIGMTHNNLDKLIQRLRKLQGYDVECNKTMVNGYVYTEYAIGDVCKIYTDMLGSVSKIEGGSYDEIVINKDICGLDALGYYGLKELYKDSEDIKNSISLNSLDESLDDIIHMNENTDSDKLHKKLRDCDLSINISLFKNNDIINKIVIERVFE